MKRDINQLAGSVFDLAIVGGGIYGAALAQNAAVRGLRVALVEKGDFASATSANSLKIIHGGFRYLQHADIRRLRASVRERSMLMRIAPHLVHPLPVLIPTYGHGMQGKEAMRAALLLNDLLTLDRNQLDDPQKHIPAGRTISRNEALQYAPGLQQAGLTGGAIFYDAQVINSERLVLAFLQTAVEHGASVANYCQVAGFLREDQVVKGVEVVDGLGGNTFTLQAKLVINTSGPWIEKLRERAGGEGKPLLPSLAKAINIVTRPIFDQFAVGIRGSNGYQDSDALAKKENSFLFIAPWRGSSLIGTVYAPYAGDPDDFRPGQRDVQAMLDAINNAYPDARLSQEDVSFVHAGLLPGSEKNGRSGSVELAKHHVIYDHRQEGVDGLLSVVGVKYTTARQVAEKVVDYILKRWGKISESQPGAAVQPLHGGNIERFDSFIRDEVKKQPCGLTGEQVKNLVYNYGSAIPDVLKYFDQGLKDGPTLDQALIRAQTLYAVRDEMAQTAADVLLRRTDLGSARQPGKEIVSEVAGTMGNELGWDQERVRREIEDVDRIYNYSRE